MKMIYGDLDEEKCVNQLLSYALVEHMGFG